MKEWYLEHNMITSFAMKTAGSYIGLIWWKIKIGQLEILSSHKVVRSKLYICVRSSQDLWTLVNPFVDPLSEYIMFHLILSRMIMVSKFMILTHKQYRMSSDAGSIPKEKKACFEISEINFHIFSKLKIRVDCSLRYSQPWPCAAP